MNNYSHRGCARWGGKRLLCDCGDKAVGPTIKPDINIGWRTYFDRLNNHGMYPGGYKSLTVFVPYLQ